MSLADAQQFLTDAETNDSLKTRLTTIAQNNWDGVVQLGTDNGKTFTKDEFLQALFEKSPIITKEGKVGIGTEDPTHKLHVKTGNAVGLFESTGDQAYLRVTANEDFDNRVEFANRGGGKAGIWVPGAGDAISILKDGKVGVGTTTPDAKLAVNGDLHVDGVIKFGGIEWELDTSSWKDGNIVYRGAEDNVNFGFHGEGSKKINLIVDGDIKVGESKSPIIFKRYDFEGQIKDTGYKFAEYNAAIVGIMGTGGGGTDLRCYMNKTHDNLMWHIVADMEGSGDKWNIDVMFVRKEISSIDGSEYGKWYG